VGYQDYDCRPTNEPHGEDVPFEKMNILRN
jgi:hypothetical protein